MSRFIEGANRYQCTLFPESLDEYVSEDNAVRVVDVRDVHAPWMTEVLFPGACRLHSAMYVPDGPYFWTPLESL